MIETHKESLCHVPIAVEMTIALQRLATTTTKLANNRKRHVYINEAYMVGWSKEMLQNSSKPEIQIIQTPPLTIREFCLNNYWFRIKGVGRQVVGKIAKCDGGYRWLNESDI